MVLLAIVVGATLAGADWGANTMTTLLTWEPRRLRVLFTRALVVALVVIGVALILQGVFAGLFTLLTATRGSTEFLPPDFWARVITTSGRVSLIAAAFGLMSFAVGMIGRSTVAALAVLFGYLIAIEGVLAGFRPKVEPFLAIRAAIVVINRQPLVTVSGFVVDTQRAVTVLAIYVVGLLVVAGLLFRRRDVT
jgi:ABC-2 type transport system permease protein